MRSVVSLVCLSVVLVGCPTDEEEPPPSTDSCDDRIAAWDTLHAEPRASGTTVLDPRLVRDASGQDMSPAADGDLTTVARLVAPAEIVVRLDRPMWVSGLRYTPEAGSGAATDFRVFLGLDSECWGEPVAQAAFDGSDVAQEASFEGRHAQWIRLAIDGSSDPNGTVAIAELGLVVEAGIESTPPAFAAPGIEWHYAPAVTLPSVGAPAIELRTAPDGMAFDGTEVTWTPREDQSGSHDVVLAATSGTSEVEQRFTIQVAMSRVVTSTTVPPTGGTVTVMGSGTSLDGMEVDVPPSGGSTDVAVEIAILEGALPAEPMDTLPVGSAFSITADVPDDAEFTIRVPLASIAGLPADADPEGVFIATTGIVPLDQPGLGTVPGSWLPTFTRVADGIARSVVRGARRAYYRIVYGPNVVVTRLDQFFVKMILEMGESRAGKVERLEAIAADLVTARDAILGMGCTFRDEQSVLVRKLETVAGWVLPSGGELELDRAHFINGAYPTDILRDIVNHELAHVFQWINGVGMQTFLLTEHWWLEATAVYVSDEVTNVDSWVTYFPPYDELVTREGLTKYGELDLHRYRLVTFFKSLKARGGGFNACTMMRERRTRGTGMAALEQMLGGSDATLSAFADFVAAYDFIRTEDRIEDIGLIHQPGWNEFAEPHSYAGWREYTWRGMPLAPHGGHTARFMGNVDRPQTVTIRVESPTDGYIARVYDASHELLAELRSGAASATLDAWTGDFYVTLAFSQNSTPSFDS